MLRAAAAVSLVILASAAAFYIYQQAQQPSQAVSEATTTSQAPCLETAKAQASASNGITVRVVLRCQDRVLVIVDGEPVWNETLTAGSHTIRIPVDDLPHKPRPGSQAVIEVKSESGGSATFILTYTT